MKGGDADIPQCFDPIFLNETVADTPAVAPSYIKNTNKEQKFGGWSFEPNKGDFIKKH